MTYQETIEYLFSRLPMFQRVGAAAYKKDLTRTIALCEALGNPEKSIRTIHIAGTNGKGSVTHMIAAVLQTAGYKVGVYTSPHYADYRERFKINGVYIPEDYVVDFVRRMKPLIEEIEPSYFELTTAMAFEYFRAEHVDFAIIETGMGGRRDSTNIINPVLSVITNISYDHMQFLGNTLPEIAGEKAGIIKSGVPVVIGERQPETDPVFMAEASAQLTDIYWAEDHWQIESLPDRDFASNRYRITHEGEVWAEELVLGLFGNYQQYNTITALEAIYRLSKAGYLDWDLNLIRKGFADIRSLTRIKGRWEKLGDKPLILADSAHNQAGIRLMLDQVADIPCRQLHVVYGMVNDKDISKALSLMPREALYYFCKPDIPRGLDQHELLKYATETGLNGIACGSVNAALEAAREKASPEDMILICGSIFVLAELI